MKFLTLKILFQLFSYGDLSPKEIEIAYVQANLHILLK